MGWQWSTRRGGVKTESSEALQSSAVAERGAWRPKQDKRRARPNPEDISAGGSSAENVWKDAATEYSQITDECGREYTRLACSDRECLARTGKPEFEPT